ncbi:Nanos 2 [Merluccius polli]|uniref:Nanos 2 n=1 Tax=Merluccius polli TaxID=89951 RepID=A0AA47NDA5_MERPO|nr:Nanos 2 [Merluccius polli]
MCCCVSLNGSRSPCSTSAEPLGVAEPLQYLRGAPRGRDPPCSTSAEPLGVTEPLQYLRGAPRGRGAPAGSRSPCSTSAEPLGVAEVLQYLRGAPRGRGAPVEDLWRLKLDVARDGVICLTGHLCARSPRGQPETMLHFSFGVLGGARYKDHVGPETTAGFHTQERKNTQESKNKQQTTHKKQQTTNNKRQIKTPTEDMQRRHDHVVAAAPHFNMWRDYMGLALTVKRMRDAHETEHERQAHESQDGGGKGGKGGKGGGNGGGNGGGKGGGNGGGNGGGGVALFCRFCFRNGEAADVYTSHELRSGNGMRITCPILRAYTCPNNNAQAPHAPQAHESQDGGGKGGKGGGKGGGGVALFCRFCFRNGEAADVYTSHELRSGNARITCPILRAYTCPVCRATGDHAHTLRHCPYAK